jgi:site-specific DNA-methyltransferase (adenine-specific)
MPDVKLMLGDCLERMADIPDGSVDAIVADPPYGLTDSSWDDAPDWLAWWTEAQRVCKPDAYVALFCQMPTAVDMFLPAREHFRYDLVGHKNIATGHLNANRCPMRNHELVYVFAFGRPAWNRIDWTRTKPPAREIGAVVRRKGVNLTSVYRHRDKPDVYVYGTTEAPKSVFPLTRKGNFKATSRVYHHPNAKPVGTMEWLVKSYSPDGGTVLDPWIGSGTTGVACLNTGRNFTGIERDAAYFAIAERRIAEYQAKTPLLESATA